MALLEAKHVTFTYPDEMTPALNDVSFTVQEGEFIVLCGPSGGGKSTLLRLLKPEIAPHGDLSGEILFQDEPIQSISPKIMAQTIGMVFQDPENQIVMDSVMEELIFGLENIGLDTAQMRKKVAEIVHFFGLNDLFERSTHELSGGQKQIVNLASVLLMEPRVLLLDEPTSQLDPIAAKDFLNILRRMNEELGIAVVIAEHRLEDVWPLAERVVILENGQVTHDGPARDVAATLSKSRDSQLNLYLPAASHLFMSLETNKNGKVMPITVKEGQHWAKTLKVSKVAQEKIENHCGNTILEAKQIDFQYEKGAVILNRLSLQIKNNECIAIVGGNGTGKTTLLKVLAGLMKPLHGAVYYNSKKIKTQPISDIGYLPQNPRLYFTEDTVGKELDLAASIGASTEKDRKELLEWLDLHSLESRHPYDLSGGEMQKVAMACLFLRQHKIILIDEPTKGLDPISKKHFVHWIKLFNKQGLTVVFVTHDLEFSAQVADRVAMMFRGDITLVADTDTFFKGNAFYTTVVDRITRGAGVPEVLTVEEAVREWDVQSGSLSFLSD